MASSGQITVTTAGTAVQGTSGVHGAIAVKALANNAGLVYIGNDAAGDVTSANGFELAPSEGVVIRGSLDGFWFDAATNGDKLSWIRLN